MVDSGAPIEANQLPPVTQRLQQDQEVGVRLTGNSEVFQLTESVRS